MINTIILYAGCLVIYRVKNVNILGTRKNIILAMIIFIMIGAMYIMSIPKYNRMVVDKWNNPFVARIMISLNKDYGGLLHAAKFGRFDIWEKTLDVWHDNPIFGCGQGQLYWKLRSLGADDTAASQFLLVLGEMGIFGFVIFLWVIGALARDLVSPLLRNGAVVNYANWFLLSAVLINIFIQSFTIHVLHFMELPLLFGVIFAAAIASVRNNPVCHA